MINFVRSFVRPEVNKRIVEANWLKDVDFEDEKDYEWYVSKAISLQKKLKIE